MASGGPDRALVGRVVAELLSSDPTGEPEPLAGGFDNESWVVPVRGFGRVLLRISRPNADLGKLRSAWRAQELAVEAGVPTGRGLRFSARCEALDGRACRVVAFVEGRDPGGFAPGPAAEAFFGSLGAAMARMHAVHLDAFSSRVDGSAPAFESWSDYVGFRVRAIVRRAVTSGAFEEREISPLLLEVAALCREVDDVVTPSLTHRDLHLANLVAGQDGRLSGIVDWDAAEAWDPMVDFVKLRWQVFPGFPGASEALWAAYSPGGAPPMLSERLRIVDVLELANGVANSRIEGWADYEEQNRSWLAAALGGSGA